VTIGGAGSTVRFGGYNTAGVLVNDANGNITTNTTLLGQVATNTTNITTLQGHVGALNDVARPGAITALQGNRRRTPVQPQNLTNINIADIRKANEGVAMALAMESPFLPAGTRFGVAGGIGYYQNRLAGTASFAARVGTNASVLGGVGVGFDSGEVGARAGFQLRGKQAPQQAKAGPGLLAPARLSFSRAALCRGRAAVGAGAGAGGPPPARPGVPDPIVINKLIWSAMAALDQANQTGNYSVLRDLGAPGFQAKQLAATLGADLQPPAQPAARSRLYARRRTDAPVSPRNRAGRAAADPRRSFPLRPAPDRIRPSLPERERPVADLRHRRDANRGRKTQQSGSTRR
jgi:hypothetical protein